MLSVNQPVLSVKRTWGATWQLWCSLVNAIQASQCWAVSTGPTGCQAKTALTCQTSEGVLWCLAPGWFIVDPLGSVCWGMGPPWTCSSMSYRRYIRLGSVEFGGPVNTGHIVLLRGHCPRVVSLWWGGVLGPQQCLNGWCVTGDIHMRWSMLFASLASGFIVVADWCIYVYILHWIGKHKFNLHMTEFCLDFLHFPQCPNVYGIRLV